MLCNCTRREQKVGGDHECVEQPPDIEALPIQFWQEGGGRERMKGRGDL